MRHWQSVAQELEWLADSIEKEIRRKNEDATHAAVCVSLDDVSRIREALDIMESFSG